MEIVFLKNISPSPSPAPFGKVLCSVARFTGLNVYCGKVVGASVWLPSVSKSTNYLKCCNLVNYIVVHCIIDCVLIHHHHRFLRPFVHTKARVRRHQQISCCILCWPNTLKTECPSGSVAVVYSRISPPHRGPFLRNSVLLFDSVGELTISQNHHHEGTKEQIGN